MAQLLADRHNVRAVRDQDRGDRVPESDWLGRFLADECEIGKGYTVKGCDLQAAYAQYCDINGDYRRHPSDFKAAMEAAGFGWHKTRVGAVYYGLRLGVETL